MEVQIYGRFAGRRCWLPVIPASMKLALLWLRGSGRVVGFQSYRHTPSLYVAGLKSFAVIL